MLARRRRDLRHTAARRMLAAGKSLHGVAKLPGWSAATAVRAGQQYGHFSESELRGLDEDKSAHEGRVAGQPPAKQSGGHARKAQVNEKNGSSGRIRTYNPPVNSRMLYH